jgi:CHAD domain-containing protein
MTQIAARQSSIGLARRPVAGSGSPGCALVAYLTTQRDAVRTAEGGVRSGDVDAVHDMRVATRRLRSTLRTFRAVLRPWQPLRAELKWLAGVLGDVRDGDVLADRLGAAVAGEPPELVIGPVAARLRQRLASDTAPARERLRAALNTDRYRTLLESLDELVAAGPTRPVGRGRLRRATRKALRRADRQLAAAKGSRNRAARLHQARRTYKRARYAVEVLRPVAGKPAKRLRRRLSTLQDVLGAHQDAVVTADLLRTHAMRAFAAGENTFTYGVLYARQERVLDESRRALPDAAARVHAAAGWLYP